MTHRIAWLFGLLCCVGATPARAQEPSGANEAGGASQPDGSPLALRVVIQGYASDAESIRRAVAQELGRPVVSPERGSRDDVESWATLVATRGEELVVTVGRGSATGVSRRVVAPDTAEGLVELSALLVGNLARDESSAVLAELASSDAPATSPRDEPLDSAAVNLSLFHPLATLPEADRRDVAVELGLLYGRVGALSAVGLSLGGVLHVLGDAQYVQLAGLGYVDGASARGVRLGGAFGVGGGRFDGFSMSGALELNQGALRGAQLAGMASIALGELDGLQAGGAASIARDAAGLQLAGGVNVARDVEGAQLSGALNVARRLAGVQLAAINVGGDVDGVQIGVINVARDVEGAQLGVINVARDVKGASIGVATYSQRGRTQAVSWYGTLQPINVGVRFYTGPLYAMPTFGYSPGTPDRYAPGFSLGARLPVYDFFADLDVNYQNPTEAGYDEHEIDLRYRLLVGYQVSDWFGLFAGGGVRHHFRTQGDSEQSVDPEATLGVQLL